MAVSDFVYPLTDIPVELIQTATSSQEWLIGGTIGLIFCKLKWFLQNASSNVSIQSLLWIALDRFVAVVLPMKVHLISSRFRVFAITSTWVIATIGSTIYLYASHLVDRNGKTFCVPLYNTFFSYMTYLRVHTALFQILPLVVITILYCVIAVTLRRRDKILQCRAVHQKDQKKRRAIKMTFCIMASFYICFLPILFRLLVLEYNIELPCLFPAVLWHVGFCGVYLSAAINPIICISFVQSYRLGLKEMLNWCWRKRLTIHNMETTEDEEITLQSIRAINVEENRTQC
ncbi:neuropeptides capa receptor-like [Oculina patagonica]